MCDIMCYLQHFAVGVAFIRSLPTLIHYILVMLSAKMSVVSFVIIVLTIMFMCVFVMFGRPSMHV